MTLSVELYELPGATTHISPYFLSIVSHGISWTGSVFQSHNLYTIKNYANNWIGLWFGNIWHIFASIIAHEIPPKYPIPLELIPLFFAHTLITLKVSLKFYTCLPVNYNIIKLFFLPSKAVWLLISVIELINSELIVL